MGVQLDISPTRECVRLSVGLGQISADHLLAVQASQRHSHLYCFEPVHRLSYVIIHP